MEIQELIKQFELAVKNSPTGVAFVGIRNYTSKESGKVSDILINVGSNLNNAKKSDIQHLKELSPATELEKQALHELIGALEKPDKARSQAQTDAYIQLIPGVRLHKDSGKFHIYGMKVRETVIREGEYGEDRRRELTKVKDRFRAGMKSTKFRTYIVDNLSNLRLAGQEI